jgi:hypothetical protein
MDNRLAKIESGFQHPHLGLLTDDEVRYMRQVPVGYEHAEWSNERLESVRKRISIRPHQ